MNNKSSPLKHLYLLRKKEKAKREARAKEIEAIVALVEKYVLYLGIRELKAFQKQLAKKLKEAIENDPLKINPNKVFYLYKKY